MHLTTTRVALLAGAALLLSTVAASTHAQDYTVGANARTFAMGGAGIALAHYAGSSGRANPASLAFERKGAAPTTPTLAYRADGPAGSNIGSAFLLSGAKPADAISIAAKFGSENATYGVSGYTALRLGHFEVSASGVGISHVLPNAAWSNWVENGQRFYNTLPTNAKVDFYNAGYLTLPGIAYGNTLPGHLAGTSHSVGLGIRVNEIEGIYSHLSVAKGVNPATNAPMLDANLAPEMKGRSSLNQRGLGADLGVLIAPRSMSGFSVGFAAQNLVKPSIVFTSRDASGNITNRFDIVTRSMTAGLGWVAPGGRTVAAADFANIGGGRDVEGQPTQDMRLGVEQWVSKKAALRGGYSKLNGATYGFGLYGVNLAFGGRVPLQVGRTLNF